MSLRCAVVEGSALDRDLLAAHLGRDSRFAKVLIYSDGEEFLAALPAFKFDVVAVNATLPGLSGADTVEHLMATFPTPAVLYFRRLESEGLKPEEIGATSVMVLELEDSRGRTSLEALADRLVLMSSVKVIRRKFSSTPRVGTQTFRNLLAIGASSGAPTVVENLLSHLRGRELACFIVQHLPMDGAGSFARWLEQVSGWPVKVAEHEEPWVRGQVYVAPYGRHLEVGKIILKLVPGKPYDGHCPSASRLFLSLARSHGPETVGLVLSGMGKDGARGLLELRRAGGWTIAESSLTAAVSGMPRSAEDFGAAREILRARELPGRVARLFPKV